MWTAILDPLFSKLKNVHEIFLRFDDEAAINHSSIAQFLREFTRDSHHRVGSEESSAYAEYIVSKWKEYKIEKVEIDRIHEMIPRASKVPSEITIRDENGTSVWSLTLPELEVRLFYFCVLKCL